MPGGAPKLVVPRWIQLVGLPVIVIGLWVVGGRDPSRHLPVPRAGLIAVLLNPLVRGPRQGLDPARLRGGVRLSLLRRSRGALGVRALHRRRRPDEIGREPGRFLLYGEARTTSDHRCRAGRRPLQEWLNHNHLERVHFRRQALDFLDNAGSKDVSRYTSRAISWAEGAAVSFVTILFSTVLVIVISVYMLLDMPRLARSIDRRFPPRSGSPPLMSQIETSVVAYVKGQFLLSLIIGTSAGSGSGSSARPASYPAPIRTRSSSGCSSR
jgi:hypothetical protein